MDFYECVSSLFEYLYSKNVHYYLMISVGAIAAVKAHSLLSYSKKRKIWDSTGKDVVLIHQFSRSKGTPNMSPFPIKLETFCRMAGIKYKVDFNDPLSPKGKCPWMTINGQDIADSQFCINYLRKKFNVDLNSHLTKEEKAIARSFRVLFEDHFYWPAAVWRWSIDETGSVFKLWDAPFILKLMKPLIGRNVVKSAKGHGIGRHSVQEIYQFGIEDARALSDFLGKKKFLMGDQPCEEDCAIFGLLVQAVWNLPGSPFEAVINNELTNLRDYVIRMKDRFWPDWEEAIKSKKNDFTDLSLK